MATAAPSNADARRFPLWAKITLATFTVLLLIAEVAPYFLNVDRYRDTIVAAIQNQTGRCVTVGKIRARFLPRLGFVLKDLHIGSPQNFPAGDLVVAGEIRGNLALGPLLHGTIHLNSLDLMRPKVTLVTDRSGKNNYTFPSSPRSSNMPQDPRGAALGASKRSDEPSSGVSLDQIPNISVIDAEVLVGTIVGGALTSLLDVQGINATLHNFAVNPVIVHDWQVDSELTGVTLALRGWRAPIAFRLGQLMLSNGKLDVQFVADLAQASDMEGTLSVPDVEHAQFNFEMSAADLDVNKLVNTMSGESSGSWDTPAKAPDLLPGPSELIARGHINIEKIAMKPYTLSPAHAEIRVFTDRAELWPIAIGMFGGTLEVSSRVDRTTRPARFTANVLMRNLDMTKVLQVLPSMRDKMAGTGEFDLQLLGNLSPTWIKTLSGTGKFAVHSGHLPGLNLGGASQGLVKLTAEGGDTPFTVIAGDIDIARQRISSKQVHLDSASGIVDLRGSVGFDGSLDYQGQISVNLDAVAGSGSLGKFVSGVIGSRVGKITVPITLSGTIQNPRAQPANDVPGFPPQASAAR
jgi:uncharacterized protein involved in outer membrane biogenesis